MSINVTVSGGSSVNVTASSSNLLNLSAQGYTLHANTHENGGVDPIDHNLLRSIQGGQINEYYHLTSSEYNNLGNVTYITGNQNISGIKNFYIRPTVNGSGVLLDGEAQTSNYVNSISGNLQTQIINLNNQTGTYYLNTNPSGYITGINNIVYTTGNQIISGAKTFATGVDISGNLTISGAYNIYQEIEKAKILALAYAIAL